MNTHPHRTASSNGIKKPEPPRHVQAHPAPATKARSISFYVLLGAGAYAFIEAYQLLSPILLSFILIIFISLALNPLVLRMRAFVGGRKVAAVAIAGAVLLVVGLTCVAFFGPMSSSIANLSKQLPEYWARAQKPLVKMEQQAAQSQAKVQAEVASEASNTNGAGGTNSASASNTNTNSNTNSASATVASTAKTASAPANTQSNRQAAATPMPAAPPSAASSSHSSLGESLQALAGRFAAVAVNAAQIMVVLITVFFGVTFTLMNPRPVLAEIFAVVPERHHPRALIILRRIGKFLPDWAFATLTAMLVVGTLVFALMWPLLGFGTALVLGLIAAVLEAIPYLGPLLSAIPAVMFSLTKGGSTPIWVMLAYLAVQLLENNVIAPHVMARGMKLHSVAVIFSMLFCIVAFGVLGALAAAPLVAVAQILHEEIYRKRFLPSVSDADLDRLARNALGEPQSAGK